MRDLRELSGKIAELIELLSEMGELEIKAEIRFDGGLRDLEEARIFVHLTGRDTPLLTADNGRVLDAIETLSMDMLGLTGKERERIRFDAGNFLAEQRSRMRHVARTAIEQVEFSGKPHVFPPMGARDRELLRDALHSSGLSYETLGKHSSQWLILFPKEIASEAASPDVQASSLN